MYKWFTGCWWQFLLEKPLTWTKFVCRIKGHPEGVWWYSNGLEPDMHCKTCEDDLG